MNLLFICREDLPTYRPDVCVLIEQELAQYCSIKIISASDEICIDDNNSHELIKPSKLLTNIFGSKLSKVIGKLIRTIKLVRKNEYDLVIVRDNAFLATAVFLLSKFYRVKSCFWMSILVGDLIIEDAISRRKKLYWLYARLYKTIESWAKNNVDLVVAQSDEMKSIFDNDHRVKGKIISCPMGVSEAEVNRFINSKPIKKHMVGYLGTIDLSRNINILLDVISKVSADNNYADLTLKIVGGSVNKASEHRLIEEIKHRGLTEQIIFTGILSREEAWNEIAVCDVCISYIPRTPIFDVSSPTKLVEYLALGKKVVANDIPDQIRLLNSLETGSLCQSDIDSIATAVIEQLNLEVNESTQARLRQDTLAIRGYRVIAKALYRELQLMIKG